MNPALSVILFTTLSGAGYGLLVWVGLGAALAPASLVRPAATAAVALALVLAATGLLASLWHLGHPGRAWRAFSQWRSSWLSREGVAASASFAPGLLLLFGLLRGVEPDALRWPGALSVLLALATTYCTARIYSSLKTVAAWHNGYVVPGYLLFALWSGTLWFWLIGAGSGAAPPAASYGLTALLSLAVIGHKTAYWRALDRMAQPATAASATGLGRIGSVRAFEAPHTESNYLTREMGFRLARKHSARLRAAVVVLALCVLPALLGAWLAPRFGFAAALVAVLAGSTALFVERWLFFAEAKHVVMSYYGGSAA